MLYNFNLQAQKLKTKKLFIDGVPVTMGKDPIQKYFSQFGEVGGWACAGCVCWGAEVGGWVCVLGALFGI